jgi:DNA-binding response OmpR family regulator
LKVLPFGAVEIPARILVVDDDPAAARLIAEMIRRAGYEVDIAVSGEEALEKAATSPPDLMLLDYDMPDMDATEVLEHLKRATPQPGFPVLILTGARLTAADQILGLDRGASDYIVKGVDRPVLLARVRRALRDREGLMVLQKGRLKIDPSSCRAWLGERVIQLERKPFWVLYHLARREGRAMSREELLELVWGTRFEGYEHSVTQAVFAARKALGERGWIVTVARHGYRFATRP